MSTILHFTQILRIIVFPFKILFIFGPFSEIDLFYLFPGRTIKTLSRLGIISWFIIIFKRLINSKPDFTEIFRICILEFLKNIAFIWLILIMIFLQVCNDFERIFNIELIYNSDIDIFFVKNEVDKFMIKWTLFFQKLDFFFLIVRLEFLQFRGLF